MDVSEQFHAITTVLESLDVGVYVSDLETHELLFVNTFLTRWFGECTGKKCYEAIQVGQTRPCSFCTNERLVVDGKPGPPVVWEFRNTVNGRWVLCIDKAIPWIDGRLVRMEVAVDITDRKAAEQFRDEYVSLISHDLRSPLHQVTLRTELLRRALRAKGLVQEVEITEQILAGARRVNVMIEDLVETTRLESKQLQLHRRSVDLGQLLVAAAERLCVGPEKRVRVEGPSGDLVLLLDPERVERVVENLVGNALRFSPTESQVTVRVKGGAEGAEVSVEDQGVGIPARDLPHVFERFYRAKKGSDTQGLGLGLYIARLIVEGHGGRLWAQSVEGEGSTFHFTLPRGGPLG